MNLTNLKKKTYKNYRELCVVLEEDEKRGNSKSAQIKEWERYFKFEKEGHKIMVKKIYDSPLEKIDDRKSIYYDDLNNIILYTLNKCNSDYMIWSLGMAMSISNMVNDNYRKGKENISKTSKALNIDENYIYDFYSVSQGKFKKIFETTLRRMEKDMLIDVKYCTVVCKNFANIKLNEESEPIIVDGKVLYNTKTKYVEANDYEIKVIMEVKSNVLKALKCKDEQECFLKKKWNEYIKRVNRDLRNRINVEFAYKGYKLVLNKDKIHTKVTQSMKDISTTWMNDNIIDSYINSGNKLLNSNNIAKALLVEILINDCSKYDLEKMLDDYENKSLEHFDYQELDTDIPF